MPIYCSVGSSYPAGPTLTELYPEITDFVRLGSLDLMLSDALVEYNENTLYEKGILLTDSNFFDLFTHPVVNNLLMKDLAFSGLLSDWRMIGAVLLLTLITGLLSGSYPAFYLSHFRPSEVLKSQVSLSDRNLFIRKVLVGLQFTISVFMVIATFFVMQQLSYMRNKDLGYTTQDIMVLNVADLPEDRRVSLQRALDQLAAVESSSLANSIPGPGSSLPNWGLSVETQDGFMDRML